MRRYTWQQDQITVTLANWDITYFNRQYVSFTHTQTQTQLNNRKELLLLNTVIKPWPPCVAAVSFHFHSRPDVVSVLPHSVSHRFLPRSACDRVHVWGSRHTEHQRTDQTTHRLAACQVHQGNKRWALFSDTYQTVVTWLKWKLEE